MLDWHCGACQKLVYRQSSFRSDLQCNVPFTAHSTSVWLHSSDPAYCPIWGYTRSASGESAIGSSKQPSETHLGALYALRIMFNPPPTSALRFDLSYPRSSHEQKKFCGREGGDAVELFSKQSMIVVRTTPSQMTWTVKALSIEHFPRQRESRKGIGFQKISILLTLPMLARSQGSLM